MENLIGSQVVKVEDSYIIVKKNNKSYRLDINERSGDCCGYAQFRTNLFYNENSNRNPIITNVTLDKTTHGYSETSVITFYGESQEIANIESEAGSGSGYCYGACVTLLCEELNIDEDLVNW